MGKKKKLSTIMKARKGFSLLELVVAIFVFSIMMVSISGIFVKSIEGYRNAKAIQKDMESAQYAMNLMAKTIRTSSIARPNCGAPPCSDIDIVVYDYSRSNNNCVNYSFDSVNNRIMAGSVDAADLAFCKAGASITLSEMVPSHVNSMTFYFVPSSAGKAGKVTISMEICPPSGCGAAEKDRTKIQTTVSLRDYEVSGIL